MLNFTKLLQLPHSSNEFSKWFSYVFIFNLKLIKNYIVQIFKIPSDCARGAVPHCRLGF